MNNYIFDRKIIDISTALYNGIDTHSSMEGLKSEWIRRINEVDKANMSVYSMISHVGTHVDAPFHFVKDGKKIDEVPLNQLMGKAQIIEIPYPQAVTYDFLRDRYTSDCEILIFKFGSKRFDREHDYFDESGVEFLIQLKIKAIGTDNITVDSKNTKYRIHQMILPNDIAIIPALKLDEVVEGVYDFLCLPLSIKDAEASPARAILFVD